MILRLYHIMRNLCLSPSSGVGRSIMYLLFFLAPALVQGQEQADSVDTEPTAQVEEKQEGKKESKPRIINITFTPEQAQHQGRFIPKKHDHLFAREAADSTQQWWRRLYGGLGFGMMNLTDNVSTLSNTTIELHAGYKFSPVNSLRLNLNLTPYHYSGGLKAGTAFGVGLDYMVNLTNYVMGYNRARFYDAGVLVGAGVRFNSQPIPNKINPYFRLGAHAELHLSEKTSLFFEPYIGVHKQVEELYHRKNPYGWNTMYGFSGGLKYSFDEREDFFASADTLHRYMFVDLASGISFNGLGNGLMKRAGMGYQAAIGMWLNPMMGFRLSGQAQSFYWNADSPYLYGIPVQQKKAQVLLSGRLELMVSPLNFLRKWRNMEDGHVFDLNVLLGGDFGWNIKAQVPNAENGFHCYYYGFTGALQALYRINEPNTYLFIEPRFLSAMYSIPYANSNNALAVTENSFSVSLGTRVYMTEPGFRSATYKDFRPNWWIGADFGGVKLQHSLALKPDGSKSFNPMANLSVGFEWKPYAAFRATVGYQNISEGITSSYYGMTPEGKSVSGTAMWNSQYNIMDIRLGYMLNVNNVLQGYDPWRRFNVWLTAGPSLSFVMNGTNTWVEGQNRIKPDLTQYRVDNNRAGAVSPGLAGSVMATLEVARNFEITAEALAQYNFINNTNPGMNGSVNKLKYGFSVGTRYHVDHRLVKHFFKGTFADKWNRGWIMEFGGGWAVPLNSSDMLRCSGSNMYYGGGYWWNNLLGFRFGLNIQQNYWNKTVMEAEREPISGIPAHVAYTEYKTEINAGLRLEAMLNPLNFFKFRQNLTKAPKWDMNVSLGLNFGLMNKTPIMRSSYFGFTAAMTGLYRLNSMVQIYVEPRFDVYNYSRYNNVLMVSQPFTDRLMSLSVGTRVSRPYDVKDKDKVARVASQLSHRGFWAGVNVGGAKALQGRKATTKGFSFSPTVGASLGYNFTRLHSARAQVALDLFSRLRLNQPYEVISAGRPRTYYGTMESSFSQIDLRLLYMLNLSNLWTGYDRRVPFNLYFQAGPVISTILTEKNELAEGEFAGGTDFNYAGEKSSGKFGMGLAFGGMASWSLDRHWDITAEMMGQYYLGKDYMPSHYSSSVNGIKLNFSIGARYNY